MRNLQQENHLRGEMVHRLTPRETMAQIPKKTVPPIDIKHLIDILD
jgi:hypothetical protein